MMTIQSRACEPLISMIQATITAAIHHGQTAALILPAQIAGIIHLDLDQVLDLDPTAAQAPTAAPAAVTIIITAANRLRTSRLAPLTLAIASASLTTAALFTFHGQRRAFLFPLPLPRNQTSLYPRDTVFELNQPRRTSLSYLSH